MAELKNTIIDGNLRIISGSASSSLALAFGPSSSVNTGLYFTTSSINISIQNVHRTEINNQTIRQRFGHSNNPFQDLNEAVYLNRTNAQIANTSSFVFDGSSVAEFRKLRNIDALSSATENFTSNEIKINEFINASLFTQSFSEAESPSSRMNPDYSALTFLAEPTNVQYFRVMRWIASGSGAPNYNPTTHGPDYDAFIQKRNTAVDLNFARNYALKWMYKGEWRNIPANVTVAQLQSELEQISTIGTGNVSVQLITGSYHNATYNSRTDMSVGSNSSLTNGTILRIVLTGSAILPRPEFLRVIGYHFVSTVPYYSYPGVAFLNILWNTGSFRIRHSSDSSNIYLTMPKLHWNSTTNDIKLWLNQYFNSMSATYGPNGFQELNRWDQIESSLGDCGNLYSEIPLSERGSFCAFWGHNVRVLNSNIRNLLSSSGGLSGGLSIVTESGESLRIDETGPLIRLTSSINSPLTRSLVIEKYRRNVFPIELPFQDNLTQWRFAEHNFPTSITTNIKRNDGSIETIILDNRTGFNISYNHSEKKFYRLCDIMIIPYLMLATGIGEATNPGAPWQQMVSLDARFRTFGINESFLTRQRIGYGVHDIPTHHFYCQYTRSINAIEVYDNLLSGDPAAQVPQLPPSSRVPDSVSPDYFTFNVVGFRNTDCFIRNEAAAYLFYDSTDPTTADERFSGFNHCDPMNQTEVKIGGKTYYCYYGLRLSRHSGFSGFKPSGINSPGQDSERVYLVYLRETAYDGRTLNNYQGITLPSKNAAIDQMAIQLHNYSQRSAYQTATKANPRKNNTLNQTIDEFRSFALNYNVGSVNYNTRTYWDYGIGCAFLSYDRETGQSFSIPLVLMDLIMGYSGERIHMTALDGKAFVFYSNNLFKMDFYNSRQIFSHAPDFPHGNANIRFCISHESERNYLYSVINNTSSPMTILGRFSIPAQRLAIFVYDCVIEKSYLIRNDLSASLYANVSVLSAGKNEHLVIERGLIRTNYQYTVLDANSLQKGLYGGNKEAVEFADPTTPKSLVTKKFMENHVSYKLEENNMILRSKFEFLSQNLHSWNYAITYDSLNRVATMSYSSGSLFYHKIYSYDSSGNVSSIRISGSIPNAIDILKTFNYNSIGNLISVAYS